jgi:hypothetical protein
MCSFFDGTKGRSIRPIEDVKVIALKMYTSAQAIRSGMLRLLGAEAGAIILIFHERGLIYTLEITRNPNYRSCRNSRIAGLLFVLFSSLGKCNYNIAACQCGVGVIYKVETTRNPYYRSCRNSRIAGLLFVLFSS